MTTFCLSSLQMGTLSSFQQKGPYSLNCGCIKGAHGLITTVIFWLLTSWNCLMLHYTSYKTVQLHNHVFIIECSKRVIKKCHCWKLSVTIQISTSHIYEQYTGKFTSSWGRKTASSCSRAAWEGGTDKERPGAGGRTARAWSWGESDSENGLWEQFSCWKCRLAVFTYQKHTMTHSQCL